MVKTRKNKAHVVMKQNYLFKFLAAAIRAKML